MANGNGQPVKLDLKTIGEWGFRLTSLVLLPLMIWMITLLLSLDKDVTVMKSNEFTVSDGFKITTELTNSINLLREDMPGQEYKDRVSELERCVVRLQLRQTCD